MGKGDDGGVGVGTSAGAGAGAERHAFVLADSLAFHGPERIEIPTDPRLYPQVCANGLEADVDLVAREGWTARDAWWALTKDPMAYGVYLPRADYVVIGVGGMDQLPASVPTWVRDSLPYVRPGGLRRRLRRAYRSLTPPVIKATNGWLRQLPQDATDRYLTRIVQAVRAVRPQVPIALLAPCPYRSPYYPSERHHAKALAAARALAGELNVALVDPSSAVLAGLTDGTANPDGMHWSWQAHQQVGEDLASALAAQAR